MELGVRLNFISCILFLLKPLIFYLLFPGVSLDLDYENLYPDREFQRKWIRNYIATYTGKPLENVSPTEVEGLRCWVDKFALSSHLFWSTWALVQACNSSIDFDFVK